MMSRYYGELDDGMHTREANYSYLDKWMIRHAQICEILLKNERQYKCMSK